MLIPQAFRRQHLLIRRGQALTTDATNSHTCPSTHQGRESFSVSDDYVTAFPTIRCACAEIEDELSVVWEQVVAINRTAVDKSELKKLSKKAIE